MIKFIKDENYDTKWSQVHIMDMWFGQVKEDQKIWSSKLELKSFLIALILRLI